MNVLILGANGQLGPYVVKALEGNHTLRLTDVNDLDTEYEVAEKEFESALEEVLVFHNPRTWAETEEESARVLALLG